MFLATKYFCPDKHTFVVTKDVFWLDKLTFFSRDKMLSQLLPMICSNARQCDSKGPQRRGEFFRLRNRQPDSHIKPTLLLWAVAKRQRFIHNVFHVLCLDAWALPCVVLG